MKILVAVHPGQGAQTIIQQVQQWVAFGDHRVDLLYVDESAAAAAYVQDPAVRNLVLQEQRQIADAYRDRLLELSEGLPSNVRGSVVVVAGRAADAITEASEGYDAVFVATHGRKGLAHFWLGSVAEKVVRTSKIPVVVLRVGEE